MFLELFLFNKGIISAQDFDNKKLGYLQADKNYKNLLSTISQLKSALIENTRSSKSNKISGTKENVTLENSQIQSFYNLQKAIKERADIKLFICVNDQDNNSRRLKLVRLFSTL